MRKLTYAIPLFLAVALVLMSQSTGPPIGFTPVGTSPAGNACSNTSVNLLTPTGVIYTCQSGVYAVAGTGSPGGAAGGDLSGNYPNPTVAQVNGAAVPASAGALSTNSSRQLIAVTTTGTGNAVLATNPTFVTNVNVPQITFTGQNVVEYAVQGSIGSTAVLALNTSPTTIVAAAGSGTMIVTDSAVFEMVAGGTAYSTSATATLAYNTAGGQSLTGQTCAAAFLTAAANRECILGASNFQNVLATNSVNLPVVFGATANPTLGTGTITYTVLYHIVSGL